MLRLDENIILSNDTYKLATNAYCRRIEFNKWGNFMIPICPECYLKKVAKKLRA